MVVWKYPLDVEQGIQRRLMPKGAKVLCVQAQRGTPTLWALVDETEQEMVEHAFFTALTGKLMIGADDSVSLAYVGSYQLGDGAFLGHVFEAIMTPTAAA